MSTNGTPTDNIFCYMVVGNFKGMDSVLKTMSHCAAHLQWDIRFVTRLNLIESLRRSPECNIRYLCTLTDPPSKGKRKQNKINVRKQLPAVIYLRAKENNDDTKYVDHGGL